MAALGMTLMTAPAHPCLDSIPISHHQGLVQGTAHTEVSKNITIESLAMSPQLFSHGFVL